MVKWWAMRDCRVGGRGEALGRMRRRSQWMFWARSLSVEVVVGRMIHRTTRAMVRGLRVVVERMERN